LNPEGVSNGTTCWSGDTTNTDDELGVNGFGDWEAIEGN
jgi:hypothetical protein